MLHIEDERRVAEEGPRCKPRVPQIASPRRGSVVTPVRALAYLLARFPTWRYIFTRKFTAHLSLPSLRRISLTNVSSPYVYPHRAISMQVKSYQFSSLTEDDEGERRMLLLFYVDRSNYPCFTTRQRLSFYICISPSRGNDFCENERYIFLPFASIRFDWIRGNRGDRLIENKTEEGTRGSLTSRASLAMPPDCSP